MGSYKRLLTLGAAWLALAGPCTSGSLAQSAAQEPSFDDFVQKMVSRPAFAHSWIGIEVYSIDRKKPLFELNADKFFTPGSTTKVVTEGAALALLGPDYRFQTRIFRSGPVVKGVLHGDLILVASGDPNLSGRVRRDGTLSFTDEDHSYGGPPFTDYPGAPIVSLAKQIAAMGIKRVTGKMLVDTEMFDPVREVGSNVVVSPIVINDNVIDVAVERSLPGQYAVLRPMPNVPYIRFRSKIRTGRREDETSISYTQKPSRGGTIEVIASGIIGGAAAANLAYPVDDPARFASAVFTQELSKAGVQVADATWSIDLGASPRDDAHKVATYTSPPLSEDVRVTLKVSQNLHAMMMPYVIGSVLGHARARSDRVGFLLMRNWLVRGGLDLSEAAQWDGEGNGSWTPRFMARYLAFLYENPIFPKFYEGLPVMGRDGTLADMLPNSLAAGMVRAKTGTNMNSDLLNDGILVDGKGLVGYTTTPSGEHVAIAIFLNKVPVSRGPGGVPSAQSRYLEVVGKATAELAAGVHILRVK
jgi:PBP4 family serine-type D-alanyl-D-alanine carboxypeptidase